MPVGEFLLLCDSALEHERKQAIREQWLALFPWMALKHLKYMSFRDYYDQCTGANIDLRSNEEILAEVEEIKKKHGWE